MNALIKKSICFILALTFLESGLLPRATAHASCNASIEALLEDIAKAPKAEEARTLAPAPRSRIQSALNFTGRYLVPVVPVWEALKDADRRSFIKEQIKMGVVTTPVSVTLGRLISGSVAIGEGWVRNVLEIFFSYQTTDVVRNAVATDPRVTENVRSWLNWYYSVVVYSAFTAGDHLAKAETPAQKAFAYGLVTYAMIWPIFSQRVKQYVLVPIMFGRFPKQTLLDKITHGQVPKEQLIGELGTKLFKLESDLKILLAAEKTDQSKVSGIQREIRSMKHDIDWVNKFREGVEDGKASPPERLKALKIKKLSISAAIAIVMTAIYISARTWLVGETASAEGDAVITDIYRSMFTELSPGEVLNPEILNGVPGEVRGLIDSVNQAPVDGK